MWHGAWWFTDCYESSLNGNYTYSEAHDHKGILWQSSPAGHYTLMASEMKIRPSAV